MLSVKRIKSLNKYDPETTTFVLEGKEWKRLVIESDAGNKYLLEDDTNYRGYFRYNFKYKFIELIIDLWT